MKEMILSISGMMCPHCEAAVKKCLEAFPEIAEAIPDHEKNQAVLHLNADLKDLTAVKQAITEAGYHVIDG